MSRPSRWFLTACLATMLVLVTERACAQDAVDPAHVETIVAALEQLQQSAPPVESSAGSFDWGAVTAAVIAVLGGFGALHRYSPQMGAAAARDPVLEERTRESRREIRRLRDAVHHLNNCVTVLAAHVDTELPEREPRRDEPDSDVGRET